MSSHPFDARLQAESLRLLEQQGQAPDSTTVNQQLAAEDLEFECKVLQRAQRLTKDGNLEDRIPQFRRSTAWLATVLCLIFAALGAVGARQAFDQLHDGVVNFYWLIIVLLGFHWIALLFWCFSLFLQTIESRSMLAHASTLAKRLLGKLKSVSPQELPVLETLFQVYWRGRIGRWMLSRISHGLWLSFLFGGLLMILLVLATRQYDFAWGTTILSDAHFVSLTKSLSLLPAAMGLNVPSEAQILASKMGHLSSADASAARQAWASLLLASLCLYGLLPRLLLLGLSELLYRRSRASYRLPLDSPYYLRLRGELMPMTRSIGIVDEDRIGRPAAAQSSEWQTDRPLPANAYYLGLELDDDNQWPPAGVSHDLGVADDRQSQQHILEKLRNGDAMDLVIVVPAQRSPDRGMGRFITAACKAARGHVYLAVSEAEDTPFDRLADWVQLAGSSGIASEYVTRLRASEA